MNTLKTFGLAVLAALLVFVVGFWLVGTQSGQDFGATLGITAYPHGGLAARFLYISTSTNPSANQTDGSLTVTGPTFFPGTSIHSGLLVTGNVTACGTTGYFQESTTTVLTPAQFLSVCNDLIVNTSGNVTTTFPAATTTYALAGSPAMGGYQIQLITNDSTNTATFVPGTGMTFKCETNGVGTTTIVGGCTSNLVTVNPTSTVFADGYWDQASSSFVIMWGNEYH